MRKFLFVLLFVSSLFGVDGYDVYQKHCQSCHLEAPKKDWVLKNLDKMKAPPMIEVSNRLKAMIQVGNDDEDVHRELVITFIKDYIQHPSIDKSFCHLGAIERFDVMPPIGRKLTPEERQAVAEWVFGHYDGKAFN